MQRRTFYLFTLLAVMVLGLLACDLGTLSTGKPTVIISSPPSGSQYRDGEDVAVQSTSTDSTGIVRVELAVDGAIIRTDPSPSAQVSYPLIQTWKATPGTHTITVRAYNTANVASDPAAVSITVLSASGGTVAPPSIIPNPPVGSPIPTATLLPPIGASPTFTSPAPSGACTNLSIFVADVTVPDGTLLAPGQTFNKIWRLRNTGTCTWGAGYQFVFVAGEAMTTALAATVPNTPPGATADLLVAMTAPAAPGLHYGQWRLKNSAGALFGITVNVTINVTGGSPPPTVTSAACSGAPVISSFTAGPTTVSSGGAATLSWGLVSNADSVEIDQGIGGVATPGNIVVNPTATTTYTMTARCGTVTRTAQVTVTVNFAVTGVTAAVDVASASVTCGTTKTFNFSAIIAANAPGTVTYKWERSDGASQATASSVTFAAAGSQTVSTTWTLGPGATPATVNGWERVHILTPNDVTSNQAGFTLTCP